MHTVSLLEYILLTASALFISINPIAIIPAFLILTHGDKPAERARIAAIASGSAGLVLALFAFAGTWILKLFGLSLPAIQIAGSIVLLGISLDMVYGRSDSHLSNEETRGAADKESVALMPLAVPMLADPGAISTTFIMQNKAADLEQKLIFYVCLAGVMIATFVILRLSVHGANWIGPVGQKMMSRLMGLLLCAVAIQFAINALKQMGMLVNS